jgi:hypothetical protein
MRKTAIDIIRQISTEVEDRKLPLEIMVRDIQMMQFKIRSLIGDISSLETAHYEFVHALWKIGKIDEIISNSLEDLDEDDQQALITYFNDLESRTQTSIRHALRLQEPIEREQNALKIEIFKDIPLKSTIH